MNNGQWSGGKGSNPRKVNKRAYDEAYDNIFRKAPEPVEELKTEEDITDITSVEDNLLKYNYGIDNDLKPVQGCILLIGLCGIFWLLFWAMLHLFNFFN